MSGKKPPNGLRFSCGLKPAARQMNLFPWLHARQLQAPGYAARSPGEQAVRGEVATGRGAILTPVPPAGSLSTVCELGTG